MGLFRKLTSAATLGAVDFRSDKERTARYTKQQLKLMKQQARMQKQGQQPPQQGQQ